ncbi:MAG: hypothetical protein RL701_2910 [Pseudomonadota bacterium]
MTARRCRICGRDFPESEQFCSQDGARLSAVGVGIGAEIDGEAHSVPDLSALDLAADAASEAAIDALVGATLDARYRVLRVIGEGGMGVVYEALHVLIEKRVALKVLRDTFTGRPDVVERFRQEAKSASKIGHPNIVDVSDFGETPSGQSYIVMEMLTGEDLADVLARVRVLSPTRAVRIVYQVARALHATHKKSIVHRDLKPENIYLVERDGVQDFVKVVDFGVAKMNELDAPAAGRKLTRTGMLFGTPEYMSPEQSLGKPFDHRVDVYALGAILFELLSGRVPFTGENFMGILAQHGHSPVPTLASVNPAIQVSPDLEAVVMRALAKDPADRFPTMGAFAEELRRVPEMPATTGAHEAVHAWSTGAHEAVRAGAWSLPAGFTGAANAPAAVADHTPLPISASAAQPTPLPSPRRLNSPPPLPAPPRATPTPYPSLQRRTPPEPVRMHPEHVEYPDAPMMMRARAVSDGYSDAILVQSGQSLAKSIKLGVVAAVIASVLILVFVSLTQRFNHPRFVNNSHATPTTHVAQVSTPARAPIAKTTAPSELETVTVRSEARDPSAINAANTVEVQVRTQPTGASVSAVGTEVYCSAAPCALALPRGRPVTLRAETETASVERTITFDDKTEIELTVGNSRAKANKAHGTPDLKVPSIFR